MSRFEPAIEVVLAHEGGFADDPDDPGGATNWGISLRWLLTQGELEKYDFDHDGDVDADDMRLLSRQDAIELYRREWWDRYQYARISHQTIATKVMDLAVNMGPKMAHRILQRALRASDHPVVDDGVLGPHTLAAIETSNPVMLLPAMRSEAAGFYRGLAGKKSRLIKFVDGWLKRAYH